MLQWILEVNCEFRKRWAAFLICRIFARCQMYAFDPQQRHVKIHCPAKASPWMRRRKVECQGRRRFWEVDKFHLLFILQNVTKREIANLANFRIRQRWAAPTPSVPWVTCFWPNLKKLDGSTVNAFGNERFFVCFWWFSSVSYEVPAVCAAALVTKRAVLTLDPKNPPAPPPPPRK